MNPPRRAALLFLLAAFLAPSASGAALAERSVVKPAAGLSASPVAIAAALQAQVRELTPVASRPQLVVQRLRAQLSAPGASPAQLLAGQYLISALQSPQSLPLLQDFVRRARAPGGTSINAGLTLLAAPYRRSTGLHHSLVSAAAPLQAELDAAGTTLDPAGLKRSLDSMFENVASSARADSRPNPDAVDARAGIRGSRKIWLPLTKAGSPMSADLVGIGAFHENDPAKVVVMHEPGSELLFANSHPDSALFTNPVDWKKAAAEHAAYRAALEANGVKVYLVKDVMLEGTLDQNGDPLPGPKLDALRQFAGQFLAYDGRALKREFDKMYARDLAKNSNKEDVRRKFAELAAKISPEGLERYKQDVLRKMTPESLVDLILNQPTIILHLQDRALELPYVGLSQEVKLKPVMNLYFSRDQQITTHKGVVVSNMSFDQRKPEPKIMKFVFEKMGVPIVAQVKEGTLDGGDYIPVGDLVLQGQGLRTSEAAIMQLLREDAYGAAEVAVVKDLRDQDMARMHLDTVFNVLDDKKVLALKDIFTDPKKQRIVDVYRRMPVKGLPDSIGYYVKVTRDQDFESFLKQRGFQIATVSDAEQRAYALNFLNVGDSHVLTGYGEASYLKRLRAMGIKADYVPMKHLTDGYGAAHCMTQVIRRERRTKKP